MLARLLPILLVSCAYQTVNPGAPDQCEVWADAGSQKLGTVYVNDQKVYTRGGAHNESAYLDDTGKVFLKRGDDWDAVATYEGGKLVIKSGGDEWESTKLEGGEIHLSDGSIRRRYGYSSACSKADAAAGAVQVFETVSAASGPAEPQFN